MVTILGSTGHLPSSQNFSLNTTVQPSEEVLLLTCRRENETSKNPIGLKNKTRTTKRTLPSKAIIENERENKIFPDKQKLKEFIIIKLALEKC